MVAQNATSPLVIREARFVVLEHSPGEDESSFRNLPADARDRLEEGLDAFSALDPADKTDRESIFPRLKTEEFGACLVGSGSEPNPFSRDRPAFRSVIAKIAARGRYDLGIKGMLGFDAVEIGPTSHRRFGKPITIQSGSPNGTPHKVSGDAIGRFEAASAKIERADRRRCGNQSVQLRTEE